VLCVLTVFCLQSTGSIVPHTDSSRSSSLTIRRVMTIRKVIRIVMMTHVLIIIRTAIATRVRILTMVMMVETTRFSISIIVITKYQSFCAVFHPSHIFIHHTWHVQYAQYVQYVQCIPAIEEF
jgi:hypothetical protein